MSKQRAKERERREAAAALQREAQRRASASRVLANERRVKRAARRRALAESPIARVFSPRTREERRRARARVQVLVGFVVVQALLWVVTEDRATRIGIGLLSLAILPVVAHLANPRSR